MLSKWKNLPKSLQIVLILNLLVLGLFLCGSLYISIFHGLSPVHLSEIFMDPFWTHPLGTDQLGRDYLTQYILGGGITIGFAIITALGCSIIGTFLATISAYYGKSTDRIILRINDILTAIPLLPLMAVLMMLDLRKIGIPNEWIHFPLFNLIKISVIFSFIGWIQITRAMRGALLKIKNQPYIFAAKALGISNVHIILKHLLPNALQTYFVSLNLLIAQLMLFETTLSFFGIGINPPIPSWGNLLSDAAYLFAHKPLQAILPGLSITCTVFLFHLTGQYISHFQQKKNLWA
ncbi:MAG: ABC transporter permease [Alphaproteobacteria bacterium]|jgi:peptide/nickel transport system permease protein|nr:ABC transporter permease [Alphaproteobacteria bacterium]MBP9878445.1 ABC transporter permease [Alphaproteobacteria bacterium]